MNLRYPDPQQHKSEARDHYYELTRKAQRTGDPDDHAAAVEAGRKFQNASQYASRHRDVKPPVLVNKDLVIRHLQDELFKQREKNTKLRRALSIANYQLSLPVDKRNPEVVNNLHKLPTLENKNA